ncbi:MAG TPA: hypothetical protein DCR93_04950 [Cytophagales bacterium]|nr:hypothetical protein [Cytophagales bacterium]
MITGVEPSLIVHHGHESLIIKVPDSQEDVVRCVKVLKDSNPSEVVQRRLQREYDMTHQLQVKGVRQVLDKTFFQHHAALELEYIPGQTLSKWMRSPDHSMDERLQLAISLAQVVGELHQQQIVHNALNPDNLLVKDADHQVVVIDFGWSSVLTPKGSLIGSEYLYKQDLAYISPEQTGRINRKVDYRSDLYSLGIIYYELFTGRLPFKADEDGEIIHAHLARSPQAPRHFDSDFPLPLQDIILKLLAKNAQDRYDSAVGIVADLKQVALLDGDALHLPMELGAHDYSGRLYPMPRLYGRDEDVQHLEELYKLCEEGKKELVWVTGYSGSGKSSLIDTLREHVREKRGFFVSGKFDAARINTPYFALTEAITNLIQLIRVAMPVVSQERLLQEIRVQLGANARVLTDLLPVLGQWMGPQAEVPPLKGPEEQFRLQLVFQNFFRALASPRNPVVLHLDDLQWADAPSVYLLQSLIDDTTLGYLMVVGSFRDQEIHHNLEMSIWLQRLEVQQIGVEIALSNLAFGDVHAMLQDVLHSQQTDLDELTSLILTKTKGNPFFTYQLILSLYEEGLLSFAVDRRRWVWDVVKISQLSVSGNVADFMTRQINRLSSELIEVLSVSAIIGSRFRSSLVAAALGQQWATLEYYLDKLAREGWLIRQGDDFQFGHDRFQQAVLQRLTDNDRAAYHYKVAQALEDTLDVEEQEEYLFEWVRHANAGAKHQNTADRPDLLYQLNYRAGVKARTSAAFQEALGYFQRCLNMLPADAWKASFAQTLEVYQALAETAFQAGDMDQADHYLEILFDHTENIDHTLFAHELRMQTLLFRNKFEEATTWGIQLLRTLGVEVPDNPGPKMARRYERKVQRLLHGATPQTIKALPAMTDARAKAVSRILYDLSTPVYFANRHYLSVLGYLLMRQLLDHGISAWSAYAITQYAFVESVERGNIEEGIVWGALGVDMARDRHLIEILPKSILIQNVFIAHWRETYPDTVLEMEKGLQSAMEIGNYEIATNLVHNMINQTYYAGVPLTEVIRFSDNLDAQIKRFRIDNVIIRLQSYRQGFVNLMEYDELGPDRLKGELFDEERVPVSEANNPLFKINVLLNKLHLSVYYYIPDRALMYAEEGFQYLETAKGAHTFTWFYFHYALSLAGAIRMGKAPKTRLKELKKLVSQLEGYAKLSTRSFQQKYLLVKAEYDGLSGKHRKAKDGYSEALKIATQHARVNDEALIWEWGGIYYLEQQDEIMGNFYLENAFRAYRRWGATGKLQQMILDRPSLFGKYKLREQASRQYSLDLSTILKASATLSSEIQLSKLLSTLMNILLENAGADSGVFILESDGDWHIMASGHSEEGIVTNQRIPLTGSALVPEMVVETVKLMGKPVLIDDAQLSNPYSGDPFFQTHNARSVLCLPINAQGRMLGIVYLSNSLTSGIFTEQRLDLLEMLSGQIGISVENALMYEDLDQKVQERTEELKDTLEQLKEKNMMVETQNQEVNDSIAYGKTIQQAMLPEEKQLVQALGEGFVFFRPRDQVSGDFFWFEETSDYILVAAVDCTGHGVPGAFMSMIGIQLLDTIVKVQGITRPDEILNHLQRGVYEALRHEEYVLMDGMDLGICRVHKKSRTVDFAGAKNSLVYVDGAGVHRIRGAHASLSGDLRSSSLIFDLHTLELESGAMCYLYSDGFQDQFGGPHDKKFKANNFRELLGEISFLPSGEQRIEIADAFRAWKGDRDQTDDVLVLGFRVS